MVEKTATISQITLENPIEINIQIRNADIFPGLEERIAGQIEDALGTLGVLSSLSVGSAEPVKQRGRRKKNDDVVNDDIAAVEQEKESIESAAAQQPCSACDVECDAPQCEANTQQELFTEAQPEPQKLTSFERLAMVFPQGYTYIQRCGNNKPDAVFLVENIADGIVYASDGKQITRDCFDEYYELAEGPAEPQTETVSTSVDVKQLDNTASETDTNQADTSAIFTPLSKILTVGDNIRKVGTDKGPGQPGAAKVVRVGDDYVVTDKGPVKIDVINSDYELIPATL